MDEILRKLRKIKREENRRFKEDEKFRKKMNKMWAELYKSISEIRGCIK